MICQKPTRPRRRQDGLGLPVFASPCQQPRPSGCHSSISWIPNGQLVDHLLGFGETIGAQQARAALDKLRRPAVATDVAQAQAAVDQARAALAKVQQAADADEVVQARRTATAPR
jgi:hypothetical protein